jgi:hypothetical protein
MKKIVGNSKYFRILEAIESESSRLEIFQAFLIGSRTTDKQVETNK